MKAYFFVIVGIIAISIFNTALAQECVPANQRIDCHPDAGANEERCLSRGCGWCQDELGIPWCFTKPDFGYSVDSLSPLPDNGGYRVLLRRASTDSSYFGDDFEFLTANVFYESDYRLRIRIAPDDEPRYEVPLKVNPPSAPASANPLYSVDFSNSPVFNFQVKRRSTGSAIFDTSLGGLTFSNQFIQISTKLPSTNVYGIGENEQHSFRQNFTSYTPYPLWARDASPDGTTNIYGVHPYYTVVEDDGNTHSVMIVNSNAQEFILHPAPGYVYRTIGGILDIYIFLGPTPEQTVQQFTEAVGRSPLPPYWGLGFQLCRWGYDTIENMQAAVNRTRSYNIPLDVQYGDIDIMERALDFTYNNVTFHGLPEYIDQLKSEGVKFITILDPGISFMEPSGTYPPYDLGTEMDVWLKRPDGTPFVGEVWPGPTYFPDFSKNSTRAWWIDLIVKFQDLLHYDGLWIDMNEPASWNVGDIEQGCASNLINNPPYVPPIRDRNLSAQTLCMDVRHEFGLHYDTHSLYGWSESEPTQAGVHAALGKRGVVLTRSSFLGNGKWASHWLGDNFSRWSNLHYSIIGMLQFNHFGIPYVGADICGFGDVATEEMCQRWQQLGAFYTFSRNHNALGAPDQDPGNWGPAFAESTRKAYEVRYTLLPYLYTLFYHHAKHGGTVVRALWHSFPTDQVALGVDRQFLWGKGVLISPVLDLGARTVDAYFPNSRWYSYYNGTEVANPGSYQTLDAPLDFIHVHVHGGNVIPTQEPAINTELSKLNPFGLIIALDGNNRASGDLYVDDGDSIDPQISGQYFEVNYVVNAQQLRSMKIHEGYDVSSKVLNTIRLLGHGRNLSQLIVNGAPHSSYSFDPTTGEIFISALNIPLDVDLTISWI